MLIRILFYISWMIVSIDGESLFSVACFQTNKTCVLYKIDIDHSSNRAISNEVARWNKINVVDSFGSITGFKNTNLTYILMTSDCDYHAYLINITDLTHSPTTINMKTPCSQPIHSLMNLYSLALGTISNNIGGSYPVSLYAFDAISGHWTNDIVTFGNMFSGLYQVLHPQTGFTALNLQAIEPIFQTVLYNLVNTTRHILSINIKTGHWTLKEIPDNLLRNFVFSTELDAPVADCSLGGICVLDLDTYRWDLFLSIPNFHGFMDWTFSIERQMMYFISKQNITLIDLSNKFSFHYRVLPLIEQSGNINGIDKTVVFDNEGYF